jgi:molybdate transport system substrate-binding protein
VVRRRNPCGRAGGGRELLREDVQIVLGDPDTGSIGKETKISLDKVKIFDRVADKALYLTPDSKGLSQAVRSGDADVVVNWRALAALKDNAEFMDIVPLPDEQTERRILTMGRLSFSKHEELARYFLNRAISEKGREIFTVYGF